MIEPPAFSQTELLQLEYKLLLTGKILPDQGPVEDRLKQIQKILAAGKSQELAPPKN